MATLSSIRKQIASLEKKAEELIKKEAGQAIARARELIEKYGLSAEDLGLTGEKSKRPGQGTARRAGKRSTGSVKAAGKPMYQDPETGKTWTGRGKPPGWIAGASDRTAYLIDGSGAASHSPQDEAAPSRKGRAAKKSSKAKTAASETTSSRKVKKAAKPAAPSEVGRKKRAAKKAAPAKATRGRKGAAASAPARKSSRRSAPSAPPAEQSDASPPATGA
jgi:DNA-binding protein H-NS